MQKTITVSSRQPHGLGPCFGRSGSLVVEMVVCTILLGVISMVLVPSLHAVKEQRKAIRFQTLARIELNNLHQQLLHGTVVIAGSETLDGQLQLSSTFAARYPEADLVVSLEDGKEVLSAVKLLIETTAGTSKPTHKCSVVVWLPEGKADAVASLLYGTDGPLENAETMQSRSVTGSMLTGSAVTATIDVRPQERRAP